MTSEMLISARLTRASGATAAAKAMAPQARTEKTVEKRIFEVGGFRVLCVRVESSRRMQNRRTGAEGFNSQIRSGFYTLSAPPRGRDTDIPIATCLMAVCVQEAKELQVSAGRNDTDILAATSWSCGSPPVTCEKPKHSKCQPIDGRGGGGQSVHSSGMLPGEFNLVKTYTRRSGEHVTNSEAWSLHARGIRTDVQQNSAPLDDH